MVLRRQAAARVDHKDHHIGLGHRLLRLLGHLFVDAGTGIGLKAAGVDHDELVPTQATLAIVPVAGQARKVRHDGIAAFGQPIEQGGFAHIGTPDQGQHRFHVLLPN